MPKIVYCLLVILTLGEVQAGPDSILIRRTSYGVPHILATNLFDVAFGLAYAELEDYGERVLRPLVRARGDLALIEGYDAVESDLHFQQGYERTLRTYHLLHSDTRAMLDGFAAGVNFYMKRHPDKFPEYESFQFTGRDVAAVTTYVGMPSDGRSFMQRYRELVKVRQRDSANEEGSNSWAFGPERTQSGNTILVRNPHLSWSAGYYEAHITVPGKINFYGDFRIGGLFAIIGGFNERLGWSTTNNSPDLDEVYTLEADPQKTDHYLLDGLSIPLDRKLTTVEFKHGGAVSTETRETWHTSFGPVIDRADGKIYVLKAGGDGEYRRGEQFLRMMMASHLEEWKDAMRIQAITSSNYTYADADGNIFYVWNASNPKLPVASGGDTVPVFVTRTSQIWHEVIPFDQLPQLQNPAGGYLHNENDPFHFTNLKAILPPDLYPADFPEPRLRLRSQHSLSLIDNDEKFSLEDVVRKKHSMKMFLADRIKDDLIALLQSERKSREVRRAIEYLSTWDNTVNPDSRGGVLFARWFQNYEDKLGDREPFAIPWSFEAPITTPDGLNFPDSAVLAFEEALAGLTRDYGWWDLAWGDVHRMKVGELELPVGGCPGNLGCFRVLWFSDGEDGKRIVRGGDGWQLAVEFSDPPKAYSILAYGQSNNPESPWHTAQAELFAKNEMKRVAFTEQEIHTGLIRAYSPGDH